MKMKDAGKHEGNSHKLPHTMAYHGGGGGRATAFGGSLKENWGQIRIDSRTTAQRQTQG